MPLSRTFLADLERIVGAGGLVRSHEGRLVYESDMHTFYKGAPDVRSLAICPGPRSEIARCSCSRRTSS